MDVLETWRMIQEKFPNLTYEEKMLYMDGYMDGWIEAKSKVKDEVKEMIKEAGDELSSSEDLGCE